MTLTEQFEKSGGMRKGGDQEGAGEPAGRDSSLGESHQNGWERSRARAGRLLWIEEVCFSFAL